MADGCIFTVIHRYSRVGRLPTGLRRVLGRFGRLENGRIRENNQVYPPYGTLPVYPTLWYTPGYTSPPCPGTTYPPCPGTTYPPCPVHLPTMPGTPLYMPGTPGTCPVHHSAQRCQTSLGPLCAEVSTLLRTTLRRELSLPETPLRRELSSLRHLCAER